MTPGLLELPARSTSTSESVATVEEKPQVFFIYHDKESGTWERFLKWGHLWRKPWQVTFAERLATHALGAAASPDRQTFRVEVAPVLDEYSEALITAVREGRPLVRSERVRALAGEALAANSEPDDIEAWARQLARDVSDATD